MNKKLIIFIASILVVATVYVLLTTDSRNTNNNGPIENTNNNSGSNSTQELNAKNGLYTDEGLGYVLKYPTDWNISLDPNDNISKPRQEQVIISKQNTIIRIDPLGRRGAESSGTPINKETLMINGIQWQHSIFSETSERFTDVNGAIVLNDDPSTNGTTSAGAEYSYKSNFKVHLIFSDGFSKEEQLNAEKVVHDILESLEVIK